MCQNRCLAFFQKAFFQAFFYKKAIQKLHALARVINFAHLAKHKNLMKSFIPSQFNYCPVILLFYSLFPECLGGFHSFWLHIKLDRHYEGWLYYPQDYCLCWDLVRFELVILQYLELFDYFLLIYASLWKGF